MGEPTRSGLMQGLMAAKAAKLRLIIEDFFQFELGVAGGQNHNGVELL
jgi:hypothetical protein